MTAFSVDPTGGAEVARLPIVVAEWDRNSREVIRLSLDRYNGRDTIDLRSWWRDSDGTLKPGRGGLTLAVHHLPALADGTVDALRRARALGLVQPAANNKDRTAAERQRRYRQRRNGSACVTP
jgi:Transcriptional Coactivator p15 (PC4)